MLRGDRLPGWMPGGPVKRGQAVQNYFLLDFSVFSAFSAELWRVLGTTEGVGASGRPCLFLNPKTPFFLFLFLVLTDWTYTEASCIIS